jgi:cyclopropane-fatty-acyl-phospholipid synthase
MFEHLRNWERLLERLARFLAPGGELFVHIFTHREWAYPYDAGDPEDWIGRHFFTGGILPSDDLFERFSRDFEVAQKWWVNGTHYGRTAEAWLSRLDSSRSLAWPILEQTYGRGESRTWWNRWRVFLLACAEMWNYAGGEEWGVSHYRLVPQKNRARAGGPKALELPEIFRGRS